jgi:hypothetical protein
MDQSNYTVKISIFECSVIKSSWDPINCMTCIQRRAMPGKKLANWFVLGTIKVNGSGLCFHCFPSEKKANRLVSFLN